MAGWIAVPRGPREGRHDSQGQHEQGCGTCPRSPQQLGPRRGGEGHGADGGLGLGLGKCKDNEARI